MSDQETRNQLDALYEKIDTLLLEGKFEGVNTRLMRLNVQELDPLLTVGWLTITLRDKKKLSNRCVLYDRIEMHFYDRYSAKEAKKLLDGLE